MITSAIYGAPLEIVLAAKLSESFFTSEIRWLVKRGKYRETLRRFKTGDTRDKECAKVLDYFRKKIIDFSEGVWWGTRGDLNKGAPVQINDFQGIYWAWALGEDPAGYFLTEDSAILFVERIWDARKSKPIVEDGDEVHCPYCHSVGSCGHHLLTVDITFREAHGGKLYDEFNGRLGAMHFHFGKQMSEAEIFEEVLGEVALLADKDITEFTDLGPGQSSEYEHYYCHSKERTVDVVRRFRKG
jgi:hypothetical protein